MAIFNSYVSLPEGKYTLWMVMSGTACPTCQVSLNRGATIAIQAFRAAMVKQMGKWRHFNGDRTGVSSKMRI